MYCAKCDRTEWDQIACEMGLCTRCNGPLHEPDDDDGQPTEPEEWLDFDKDC